jgi:hypothetical protein
LSSGRGEERTYADRESRQLLGWKVRAGWPALPTSFGMIRSGMRLEAGIGYTKPERLQSGAYFVGLFRLNFCVGAHE